MPSFIKHQAGEVFGRLEVIEESGERGRQGARWLCRCECGNEVVVLGTCLRRGQTLSCGCLQRERASEANLTHGFYAGADHTDPAYYSWHGMIGRCYFEDHPSYKYYGEKGIRVCDRWMGRDGFANFIVDLGPKPGDGFSVDRINSSGDYEKENCRWLPIALNASLAAKARWEKHREANPLLLLAEVG